MNTASEAPRSNAGLGDAMYLLTYPSGVQDTIDRAPDSYELREREIQTVLPMEMAPKDGSEIEILFRHNEWRYAKGARKNEWQQWCRAHWIEFNGGGWTWHGLPGVPICWRPATPNVARDAGQQWLLPGRES